MRLALSMIVSAMAVSTASMSDAQSVAIGAGVGTAGIEGQVAVRLSDLFVVRGAANWLKFDRDETYDDIPYSAELNMKTAGAFIDLHPFSNAFFVSGGAYFGDRNVDLSAAPTSNVVIGGTTFTPAQVGRLEGEIDMGDTAPFVGLGFDNTFTTQGKIGFRALAGVAFGDVSTTLTSIGGVASGSPALNAQLASEAARINDDADFLKTYPVVSVGLNYKF